jgi:hypothetical protein
MIRYRAVSESTLKACTTSGDVNERSSGCRYRLIAVEVERRLSFEDVERLVVLPMDVERRAFASGSDLLDERKPAAGLLGGGLEAPEAVVQAQNASPSSGPST